MGIVLNGLAGIIKAIVGDQRKSVFIVLHDVSVAPAGLNLYVAGCWIDASGPVVNVRGRAGIVPHTQFVNVAGVESVADSGRAHHHVRLDKGFACDQQHRVYIQLKAVVGRGPDERHV